MVVDPDVSSETRTALNLGKDDALFNLTIRDTNPGGATERFPNVTVVDSARRLDKVLENESSLVRWDGDWPAVADLPKLPKVKTASDKLKALQDALKASSPDQATIDAAKKDYDTAASELGDAATRAEKKLADALKAKPQVPGDISIAQGELKDAVDAMKGDKGGALNEAAYEGDPADKSGIYALDKADLFNLLCIPPD